jgi:hypothetical protein
MLSGHTRVLPLIKLIQKTHMYTIMNQMKAIVTETVIVWWQGTPWLQDSCNNASGRPANQLLENQHQAVRQRQPGSNDSHECQNMCRLDSEFCKTLHEKGGKTHVKLLGQHGRHLQQSHQSGHCKLTKPVLTEKSECFGCQEFKKSLSMISFAARKLGQQG